MKLSRYKIKKHDQKIYDALKRLDNRAVFGFFAIPVVLGIIGGKELAKLILIIWPIYSFIYIRMFRKLSAQLQEKGMREMTNWGNRHPFYLICWVILLFYLPLALIGCIGYLFEQAAATL
ncbi:hypothetical protein [Xenorhabdus bharatensis]|uniref:hypothetical protein n=1 Tax=Xenorhabdus bharatensis TaxID=3136256 RepID=UPI0030F3EACC